MRNKIAWWIANTAINVIATKRYRNELKLNHFFGLHVMQNPILAHNILRELEEADAKQGD